VAGVEGIGLSIPVNTARPIIQSIIEKGRVIRAYLGVGVIDRSMAARYGYELKFDKGVYVARIVPGGPAAKAGLHEGDIILKIAGTETNSAVDLRSALDTQAVGSQVEVIAVRNGQTLSFRPVVEEMPRQ